MLKKILAAGKQNCAKDKFRLAPIRISKLSSVANEILSNRFLCHHQRAAESKLAHFMAATLAIMASRVFVR